MQDEKLEEKIKLKTAPDAQLPAVPLEQQGGEEEPLRSDGSSETAGTSASTNSPASDSSAVPSEARKAEPHLIGADFVPHFGESSSDSTIFARSIKLIVALAVSAVFAFVANCAIQVGYDWGYHLVERFAGQVYESNQGWGAIYSSLFFAMPMFFGFAFGCFQRAWNVTRRVRTASFTLALAAILSWCGCLMLGSDDFSVVAKLCWTLPSILFGAFGLWLGFHYYRELRRRVHLRTLLIFGIGCLMIVGSPKLFQADVPYIAELFLCTTALFATGAGVSYFARPRHRSGAVLMSFASMFPILIANILNIVGNLLCLSLDCFGVGPHLGWRALASALFINILTFGAATYGGLFGFKLLQKRQNASLETFAEND